MARYFTTKKNALEKLEKDRISEFFSGWMNFGHNFFLSHLYENITETFSIFLFWMIYWIFIDAMGRALISAPLLAGRQSR